MTPVSTKGFRVGELSVQVLTIRESVMWRWTLKPFTQPLSSALVVLPYSHDYLGFIQHNTTIGRRKPSLYRLRVPREHGIPRIPQLRTDPSRSIRKMRFNKGDATKDNLNLRARKTLRGRIHRPWL